MGLLLLLNQYACRVAGDEFVVLRFVVMAHLRGRGRVRLRMRICAASRAEGPLGAEPAAEGGERALWLQKTSGQPVPNLDSAAVCRHFPVVAGTTGEMEFSSLIERLGGGW